MKVGLNFRAQNRSLSKM